MMKYKQKLEQDRKTATEDLQSPALQAAGSFYSLNCPLTGEYKVGESWADTH